jgi:hypothetical protein
MLLKDCCNDLIRVVPKPTFAGGSTLGPPHSIHVSATALLSKFQLIAKRPVGEESDPYFAAFVASS